MHRFVLFSCLVAVLGVGCVKEQTAKTESPPIDQTAAISGLIGGMPAWSEVPDAEWPIQSERFNGETAQAVAKLRSFEIAALRSGIDAYISEKTKDGVLPVGDKSRLFILNRLLFMVPSITVSSLDGFQGASRISWPVTEVEGQPLVQDAFAGYKGEYDPRAEFDTFAKAYPRR